MTKINQALLNWTPGDIHGFEWLRKKGIKRRLAYFHVQTKVLKTVGPGVFGRSGDKLLWQAGVRFLQEELGVAVHVAARTAFELQGPAHNIPLGKRVIFLESFEKNRLPPWFFKAKWDAKFIFRKSCLFKKEIHSVCLSEKSFDIDVASRELALFEFIDRADLKRSFEEVENLMMGLVNLRTQVMQELLEKCQSVKVKRILLYVAEKLELGFLKKINMKKIDLGKGKRVICKSGVFDQKYSITVPRNAGEQ